MSRHPSSAIPAALRLARPPIASGKVRLSEIYSRDQMKDASERLHSYLTSERLNTEFEVGTMGMRALKALMANPLDTVYEAYPNPAKSPVVYRGDG